MKKFDYCPEDKEPGGCAGCPATGTGDCQAVMIEEDPCRINELFHRLWTKAVGTEGYVKKEWQEFRKLLDSKGIKV